MADGNFVVCIVGGGFGALLTHTTLRYLGLENDEIVIFGDQEDPVATYRAFAWGLGQTVLRSESESHFLPADWPTFAVLDMFARRRLRSVIRSVNRTFNPGVPDILAEARAVADTFGYRESFRHGLVGDIVRAGGDGDAHFGIYDTTGTLRARARHVLVAVGHSPLFFPPVLEEAGGTPSCGSGSCRPTNPSGTRPAGATWWWAAASPA
jgi:cation diffusion facilitator CzcD-associated flavoprotein CzcO